MKLFLPIISLVFTALTSAQEPTRPPFDLNQLKQICLESYQHCVTDSDAALNQIQAQSRLWYEVQLLKLDAMFNQQIDAPLFALTSAFIEDETAPAAFLARIYIYHAKLLYAHEQKTQSSFYLNKAVKLMNEWQQSTADPMSYIRLYNVQLYADGNYRHSYDQLLALAQRYAQSQDPVLQYHIQNNLGHYAGYLQLPELAFQYRQQAMEWADKIGYPSLRAEAHFNYARVCSIKALWQDAERHFLVAFDEYQQAGDPIAQTESQLYRSEALWHLMRQKEAQTLFEQINQAQLPVHRKADLQRIRQLLQH